MKRQLHVLRRDCRANEAYLLELQLICYSSNSFWQRLFRIRESSIEMGAQTGCCCANLMCFDSVAISLKDRITELFLHRDFSISTFSPSAQVSYLPPIAYSLVHLLLRSQYIRNGRRPAIPLRCSRASTILTVGFWLQSKSCVRSKLGSPTSAKTQAGRPTHQLQSPS